jgi:hypothetical protein
MKPIYHLSNAQQKELLVRGRALLIALPCPPIELDDPLDWARLVLPSDLRDDVVSAEEQEIRAEPKATGGRANLTDLLGAIPGPDAKPAWTVAIVCIVARLEHGQARSGTPLGPQWPANVSFAGREMLGPGAGAYAAPARKH